MHYKHIINSLPLLAAVLGRKYGVRVRIGGNVACTNGSTIYLPSLPEACDRIFLGLVRGYLDHESAHIRETDFGALRNAKLSALETNIWNILEDWRVENRLAAIFPGCRQNFRWLIRHLFLEKPAAASAGAEEESASPQDIGAAFCILEWLLLSVRAWDVPELSLERDRAGGLVDTAFPALRVELEPILSGVPARCNNTTDCIAIAREIVARLERYGGVNKSSGGPGSSGREVVMEPQDQNENSPDSESSHTQSLKKLILAKSDALPRDMGTRLEEVLAGLHRESEEHVWVAIPTAKDCAPLGQPELAKTRRATAALRVRLLGLLQSRCAVRRHNGYAGRLNTHKLHRVALNDGRVFLRKNEQTGLNTAVHILLDCSGSMAGNSMHLASEACFAVAAALHGHKGLSVGVTAFPGEMSPEAQNRGNCWQTVAPILRHNEPLHCNFHMTAAGCTPLDAALWWLLQEMQVLPEPRKLILIVSDGEPDCHTSTRCAIAAALRYGYELYGIGIDSSSLERLLPQCSMSIHNIEGLVGAMFTLLQKALVPVMQAK